MVVYKGIVIILSWCFTMIWVSKHLSVCIFLSMALLYNSLDVFSISYHIISSNKAIVQKNIYVLLSF